MGRLPWIDRGACRQFKLNICCVTSYPTSPLGGLRRENCAVQHSSQSSSVSHSGITFNQKPSSRVALLGEIDVLRLSSSYKTGQTQYIFQTTHTYGTHDTWMSVKWFREQPKKMSAGCKWDDVPLQIQVAVRSQYCCYQTDTDIQTSINHDSLWHYTTCGSVYIDVSRSGTHAGDNLVSITFSFVGFRVARIPAVVDHL